MVTMVEQKRVVDALAEEFAAIEDLLAGLADADWSAPSPCPGWDVSANVAHMIGTESLLAGLEAPPDVPMPEHVRNDAGRSNERWVAALGGLGPAALRERFRSITTDRIAALRATSPEAWSAEGPTPAGADSYGRFMRIRVFDCWMHEQDIRDAVGRAGHEGGEPVVLTLDEMASAMGFVVGKKAGVPTGSSVTFDLSGPSGRAIHVRVADRAQVVDQLDDPATVTLAMPVGVFTRLGGGRVDPAAVSGQVAVSGDAALGQQVLGNLAYTI